MRLPTFLAVILAVALVQGTEAQMSRLNDPDPYQSQYKEISEKLQTKRISLDFQDAPFNDVIQFIRQVININILVDPDIFKDKSPDELKVTLQVKDLRADNALDLLLTFASLTRRYANGVMIISTKERHQETVFMAVYDVRDMMFTIHDFPGPQIGLEASKAGGVSGIKFEEVEDTEKNELSNPERLLEIVKGNAGGTTWEDNDKCSASIINGLLVVNQTRSGHREVGRLLLMLRSFR